MCNISVLNEVRFHNNEISPVNARIVKLSCVKKEFVWKDIYDYGGKSP